MRLSTLLLMLGASIAIGCCDRDVSPEYRYYDTPRERDVEPDLPAGPPAPWSGDTLRIATFNVHRLFDTNCDTGRCDPGDYEALPSVSAFEAQVDRLAAAIAGLDAEIVLLQEIETQIGLDALFARLRDRFRDAELAETGAPASVDVAVLVNGVIVETIGHRDEPIYREDGTATTFARELLEVHIALSPGAIAESRTEVIAFVAHFKSKSSDDPDRRLAEAQAAYEIVTSAALAHPDALVVLGGDLNDTPGSPPIDALENGGALLRVAADIPVADAYTYVFSGRGQSIDHLFLALESAGDYEPGSTTVFWDVGDTGYGGSDHAALRADFAIE